MKPLYVVQALALTTVEAAEEAADRYVETVQPTYTTTYTLSFKRRLKNAYLAGLRGEPSNSKWHGNFERPILRAWRDGRDLRKLIERPDSVATKIQDHVQP